MTRDEMRAKLEKLRRLEHKIRWTGPPDGEACSGELELHAETDSARAFVCRTCGTLVYHVRLV